jgi:hypothetical protein
MTPFLVPGCEPVGPGESAKETKLPLTPAERVMKIPKPKKTFSIPRGAKQLAAWQRADGRWSSARPDQGSRMKPDIAFSALTMLTLTYCGYTSGVGRYKKVMRNGIKALYELGESDTAHQSMNEEVPGVFTGAVIAWLMSEQASRRRNAELTQVERDLLEDLLSRQNPSGSWSSIHDPDDIVYTAWAVMALRTWLFRDYPLAKRALRKSHDFLLRQLGPTGQVDSQREDRYFQKVFGKPLPARRIQLLTAAALASVARIRGKNARKIDSIRMGFEGLELDFPLHESPDWENGLLEWLWTTFAYWAYNYSSIRGGVWRWKGGMMDHLEKHSKVEGENVSFDLPDSPFDDPDGRYKLLLGTMIYVFSFAHPYGDWPDMYERWAKHEKR